jgi:hypothetical protein
MCVQRAELKDRCLTNDTQPKLQPCMPRCRRPVTPLDIAYPAIWPWEQRLDFVEPCFMRQALDPSCFKGTVRRFGVLTQVNARMPTGCPYGDANGSREQARHARNPTRRSSQRVSSHQSKQRSQTTIMHSTKKINDTRIESD